MKELLETIAKALVDNPDQLQVRAIEGEQVTVLELRVHPSDLGSVIGRQGRIADSIRTYLGCGGRESAKARQGGNPGVISQAAEAQLKKPLVKRARATLGTAKLTCAH